MRQFTIIDAADQQFSDILNGRRVTLRFRYNRTTDRWSFDLSLDDLPIILGHRIVTGVDLLAPYDLDLGLLFALPSGNADVLPGRNALIDGRVRLYHTTETEVQELLGGTVSS